MRRGSSSKLATLWRGRIERQQRSGLSIAAYCRREEISEGTFHFWKRRLKASGPSGGKKAQGASTGSRRPEVRPGKPVGGFVQVPLAAASTIEVQLVDGTQIRLPADNLAALSLMLKALQVAQPEGGDHD